MMGKRAARATHSCRPDGIHVDTAASNACLGCRAFRNAVVAASLARRAAADRAVRLDFLAALDRDPVGADFAMAA